jgi:hypothetical protein
MTHSFIVVPGTGAIAVPRIGGSTVALAGVLRSAIAWNRPGLPGFSGIDTIQGETGDDYPRDS